MISTVTPLKDSMERQPDLYRRVGKRAFDVSVACLALPVAAPVMVIVAVVIRLALGRDVVYRQRRAGLAGQHFTMLKFRTMHPDRRQAQISNGHEEDRRLNHKSPNDPRHTTLGLMLRRSGLDELPQIWNVVRGDMSLVGPRPELPVVVGRYAEWQHERHDVRPGITGLWQVGDRGTVPMHEAVATDLEYVRTLSWRTDMKILARTIPAVLRRTGA